jgi:hypothetical protein
MSHPQTFARKTAARAARAPWIVQGRTADGQAVRYAFRAEQAAHTCAARIDAAGGAVEYFDARARKGS